MKIFIPLRLKLTLYTLFLIVTSTLSVIIVPQYSKDYEPTTVILIVIAITLFISIFILDKIINVPIQNIINKLDSITKGNYAQIIPDDDDIEYENDELSIISNKFNDITKQILKREDDLHDMIHQDLLTKIPNRTMFNERLEYAIARARRQNSKLAVLFVDIDDFKNINDTLGHDIGDKLLLRISNYLVQAMRKSDLLARIGGDEFNVLIEDLDSVMAAQDIAEKLINHISMPVNIEGNTLNVTGSVGISVYPIDAKNSSALLKNADLAMYEAKSSGKNSCKFFSEELSTALQNRSTMLSELKLALQNNELELYYQPKFSFDSASIFGVEALLRWNSKKLGFLSPDAFIPLAEESTEIVRIGKWVIQTAAKDFAQWRKLGLKIDQVSINVSNVQFEKDDVVQILKDVIYKNDLKDGDLEVEITESYIHKNSEYALKILKEIREIGVDLAMDDFGTGYSSMSYLKRLPLTRLKIDKAFIDDLPNNNDDVEITKVIIALAKIMNLSTTAEGIETQEQLDFLKGLGCDEGQGYICSKPLAYDDFIKVMKNKITCAKV